MNLGMIASLVASNLMLLSYAFWLRKQVQALVAEKVLAGREVLMVPAWQISDSLASRLIGVMLLMLACGMGALTYWIVSPLSAGTIEALKTVVAAVGIVIAILLAILAVIGICGGLD